jgi:succinylglutamic semialdehyde dehydrogenase
MSHFISGEWIKGTGTPFSSVDPSVGTPVWNGNSATPSEINLAIEAAKKALPSWSLLPIEKRFAVLKRFAEILQQNELKLAEQISMESGKPLWDAKSEVGAMVGKIDLTLQAHQQRCESFTKNNALTRYKPHGLIAVLGPFNFPGHLPNGQIVPALLEGNVVLFKPSEYTPGVAELTIQYWIEAGIPTGVIQLLQGQRETGEYLSQHPSLNGLFFTGSSAVGEKLMELYAKTPEKILAVEMGGNNPLVVWNPCDIDAAVIGIISSSFISAGQRCNATRRLIIPEGEWGDELLQKLVERSKKVRVGSYRENPEPFIGSLISARAAERALEMQQSLVLRGAQVLLEMRSLQSGTGLVSPALLDLTSCPTEDVEIFAPLLQVFRVKNYEEALEKANETRFGLAASLFCEEREKFEEFWSKIRAGVIHWNHPTTAASGAAPFGGIGCSGNHRPAGYFMIDSCSYPVASMESPEMKIPAVLPPGMI